METNACTNMFGPLSGNSLDRLKSVLKNPTQETWENAYRLIINNSGKINTLWQAWIDIDPSAPRSKPIDGKWPSIPNKFTLYRAINKAQGC